MSLPFADSPDKSSIYNDLKVKKLDNLTADDFDAFRARMDAQGVEGLEDEYRRLLLLGSASNKISTSGPIPGSMYNARVEATSSGTQYNILVPNKGEVWQVCGAFSTSASGLSGTVYLEVKLRDQVNGYTAEIISTSTTSGTDVPMTEITQNPIFIDENMALQVEASGTFTNVFFVVPLIRIR